ncbi:MAG: universal stress protein [Rhizobiaceae bacterium]
MSYKTMLVYLNDKSSAEHVLVSAIALARKHGAHLIGLHVDSLFQVHSVVGADAESGIALTQYKMQEFDAAEIEGIFEKNTKKEGVSAEWRLVQAHSSLIAGVVATHARCADLIITGQANPQHDDKYVSDILEGFLIDTGRPVLVIPYVGNYENIGENITFAWNASRESARAAFAALPVFKMAKKVTVLWVNADEEGSDLPGAEIATSLARHGVNVETKHSASELPEVGDEILSRISDLSSDLLVMGAYGHSRLREFIFGGASHHILRNMTVPVIMVH